MDNDRIVEIGARALFDDWQAARGQLYGHKAMKWDREPHHQKRFRSQCRALLDAYHKAGLALVPTEPTLMSSAREVIARLFDQWSLFSGHDAGGEHADMILAAFEEAGLVVVPTEPTEAMKSAANEGYKFSPTTIYRAMIAAAKAGPA